MVDKRWPDSSRIIRVCSNRTKAKNLLDRINGAIAEGRWQELQAELVLRRREVVTLEDFAPTYMEELVAIRNKKKTFQRKQTSLNSLIPSLGKLELQSITPAHLHGYVKGRKAERVSNATVNRDLATIKHLFNYAEEIGVIAANPIEKFRTLKEDRRECPRFTDDQIQAVIEAVRPDCRPLFVFIRETGCRREEALSLQHWHVQEDSRLVVFSDDTKSRKYRYVPLTEEALEAVRAVPPLEGCPFVFYNETSGTRWEHCRKPWEQGRIKAGVPNLLVKDLRRHYAIKLAEAGADMHDIQQVLGHASVATTEKHYAQFSPKHSARKILKVLEGGKGKGETRAETRRKQVAGIAANSHKAR